MPVQPKNRQSEPEQPTGASLLGRQIGPYELVQQLGCGGMGTVYLAERRIGKLRRKVALKIVNAGLAANRQFIRRFDQEREILASLDHPNIARLLDIGSTGEGLPYLVMEYVDGVPIDVHCDAHRLNIADRLALFQAACDAITYAHGRGVIHRDLKPSNILVTAEGTVKILDFGIAKVFGADIQTQTMATGSGGGLMTIEYASPEQIRGDLITPATDVYSLGVVLYELMTGCRPYVTEGRLLHMVARAICEQPPVTPSSAVAEPILSHTNGTRTAEELSALRREQPNGLKRRLSGDLDCIVLKALRKQPEWRYQSPAEMSADVRRHLAGSRVCAREDSLRYRAERLLHHLLHPTSDVFHRQGMLMFSAGLLGILLLGERQVIEWQWKSRANWRLNVAAIALWLCWSLVEGRRMRKSGRFSALDRQAWIVLTVSTIAIGLLTLATLVRPLVTPEALAVFWNAGWAMALLIIGVQADSLITAGGIALLGSALAASFFPEYVFLCLAAGMLTGMVVPSLLLMLHGGGLLRAIRTRMAPNPR